MKNTVVANQMPFPLSVRADMAAWNKLNFTAGEFKPDTGKSAEWNRGAYLVEGLMHCGACHTPKNAAGGDKTSAKLQGSPVQGWFAPEITNAARRGLGSWPADEIVAYLKTGHSRTSAATGPMAEVVADSSKITDADLRAVATYLKDQPGAEDQPPRPLAGNDPAMKGGAAIYADACSACHTPTGTGVPQMFPQLAGSPSVQSEDPISLVRIMLSGTRSAASDAAPTAPAIPAFGSTLDGEAAAVLTYIRNSWGNAAAVSAGQVADLRRALAKREAKREE